jgi:hypothetical protein
MIGARRLYICRCVADDTDGSTFSCNGARLRKCVFEDIASILEIVAVAAKMEVLQQSTVLQLHSSNAFQVTCSHAKNSSTPAQVVQRLENKW